MAALPAPCVGWRKCHGRQQGYCSPGPSVCSSRSRICETWSKSPVHTNSLFLHLLHHDGQAHARVDGTVEMEGASCSEGANGALTRATDLQILDLRCAGLVLRFGRPIFPRSVRND